MKREKYPERQKKLIYVVSFQGRNEGLATRRKPQSKGKVDRREEACRWGSAVRDEP